MDSQFLTSRRTVIAGITAAAGTLILGRMALGSLSAATAKPDDFVAGKSGRLMPFPMTQVRLLDGIFREQSDINQTYLASLNTERLLHSFRVTSGVTSTAKPYGGWEKPDCELRGHFNGGHYLSAVALAYASAGNDTLRKNGDMMVAELARCQKANGNGYLSAFPETEFETLAKGGKVFVVYDAKSGDDITRSVLGHIIAEEEKKVGQDLLPIAFLRSLIGLYGGSMQQMVPAFLEISMDTLTRERAKLQG